MQNFKENYDIVVIGAGLAGLSCAHSASQKGVKVLVLEKNSEFGIKPCGEGIPSQIQKDFDVTPFIKNKIKGYLIYYDGKIIFHQRSDEPLGYIIDKKSLLNHLSKQAEIHGAKILTNCNVISIDRNTAITGKGKFHGKYLVFADGTTSLAKTFFNYDGYEVMPTLQYVMEGCKFDEDDSLYFFMEPEVPGYGWIFPKNREIANVGASFLDPRLIKKFLDRIVENKVLRNARIIKKSGGLVPVGRMLPNLYQGDKLVIGDAAGQVISLTGEGDRMAIIAGKLAGQALAENKIHEYQIKFKPYAKIINKNYQLLKVLRNINHKEKGILLNSLKSDFFVKHFDGNIETALSPLTLFTKSPYLALKLIRHFIKLKRIE